MLKELCNISLLRNEIHSLYVLKLFLFFSIQQYDFCASKSNVFLGLVFNPSWKPLYETFSLQKGFQLTLFSSWALCQNFSFHFSQRKILNDFPKENEQLLIIQAFSKDCFQMLNIFGVIACDNLITQTLSICVSKGLISFFF